jgi:hypothetical protein
MNTTPTHNNRAQAPTAGTPGGPPPIMPALKLSSDATGAPSATPRAALTHYELIIEQSLGRKADRAMALLAIFERKLYKLTHTSIGRYLKERWGLSRSRGYQLLRFAKDRRSCLQNGQPPPVNERQVRRLAANGTSWPKAPAHDSYDQHLQEVRRCLAANLAKTLPGEHRRFVQDVREALDQLDQDWDHPALGYSQSSAGVERSANTSEPAQKPVDSASSLENKPKTAPHISASKGLERPIPHGNTGSVLGLTMEQARRFGYVR